MQKLFKKTIAVFLVILTMMSSIPLNGFAGLDWSFLKASAVEETTVDKDANNDESAFLSTENNLIENNAKLLEAIQRMKNDAIDSVSNVFGVFSGEKSTANMAKSSLRNKAKAISNESDFAWNYDEATQTLTISGSGAMPDYEALDSEQISINTPWFSYATEIKKVVIEEGITSVGALAFALCTALTEVVLPEGITSIGETAFFACCSVLELKLPDSIETIQKGAFQLMLSLEKINIPMNIQTLGNYLFDVLPSLKELVIPDGVEGFTYDLSKEIVMVLESIINNSSTAIIAPYYIAFDSLEYAEGYSYIVSNYLKYSMIAETSIQENIKFTEAEIIESTVNYLNDKFNKSYIAADYNDIDYFIDDVVTELFVPHMISVYPPYFSVDCLNESAQHEYCKEHKIKHKIIGTNDFCTCLPMNGKIGDNITWSIDVETKTLTLSGEGEMADVETNLFAYDEFIDHIQFEENSNITSITTQPFLGLSIIDLSIPETVIDIAPTLQINLISIDEVNVDSNNQHYYSVDGILFARENLIIDGVKQEVNVLALYPIGKSASEYRVSDDVYAICSYAFCKTNISKLIIPSTTKKIYDGAFLYSNIKEIVFEGAEITLGKNAFTYYYGKIMCIPNSDIYRFAYENELGKQLIVVEDKEISSIEVNPTKTEYMRGDVYSLKDITLNLVYTDGSTAVRVTGFSVKGFDSSTLGEKTIRVYYGDITVTYSVNIIERTFKEISLKQTVTLNCNSDGETEFIKFTPTVSGTYIFKSVSDCFNLYSINVYDDQFSNLSICYYSGSSSFAYYYTYEANTTYYITVKFSAWSNSTSVDATMLCAHNGNWTETTAASCTTTGVEACVCTCCGEYVTREVPLKEHNYKETSRKNADCFQNGSITYTCSVCNTSYNQTILATHTDTNNDNICDVCGGTATTVIEKDNPILITLKANGVASLQFTPSYSGYFRIYSYLDDDTYCDTYCTIYYPNGNSYYDDNGNGKGHFALSIYLQQGETYNYQVKYASATNEGSFYVKLECDHEGNWIETKAPTCTKDGEMSCVCYYCNDSITKKISATGHKDTDNDKYCNVCSQDICLGSITVGEELVVSIKSANTNQYIRFEPKETDYFNISVSSDGVGYAYIYIIDADGNQLDSDIYSNTSPGKCEYSFEKGKTYFIRLYNRSDNRTLNINVKPLSDVNINVGSAINIPASDKETYFKFVPAITATYMFNFKVQKDYVYLYVYDSNLNVLNEYRTGTYEAERFKSFNFESGKTYYIGVGNSTKDSVLEFMCPHTDADVDNNCDICGIAMKDIIKTGTHGDNITWTLSANGELVIQGFGDMASGQVVGEFTHLVKKVVIDNGITSIGTEAFAGATLLEEITIPSSVSKIGAAAFANGVKKVTVDGGENFTVADGVLYDYNMTTVIFYPASKEETEYIMPETVVSADRYAFYGCSNIKSITFPESFETIDYTIFSWCNLDSITVLNKNATINYISTNTVIKGYIGSTAETYAQTKGNTFIALDSKKVVGISVYQEPYKTSYYSFEKLDSAGLIVKVSYDDGTTAIKEGGFEVSDLDVSSIGTKTLTVTYENFTATFDVVVKDVTEIKLNDTISLDINGSYKEYVKFIPKIDGYYKFYTSNADSYHYIYIYDSDMKLLDSTVGNYASVSYSLITGKTYYISVKYDSSKYSGELNISAECAKHIDATNDDLCDCCGIDLNTVIVSGDCGESATWKINKKNELIISGSGKINNYNSSYNSAPWEEYSDNIEKIIINAGITTIGEDAFYGLGSVKDVSLPETLTDIKSYAFASCKLLETIVLPASVINLNSSIFSNCSSLSSVTLQGNITAIPSSMFSYCSALKEISIPESVTSINDDAFSHCSALEEISIPESVTSINDDAFSYCESLKQIMLPKNVEKVDVSAFNYCLSLSKILVADDNRTFASNDGVLMSKDNKTLIRYPFGKAETEYIIPETVESIGEYAFWGSGLKSIIIPGTVKEIGSHAFASSKLKNIEINDGVTKIGSYAFYNCRDLISVRLPMTLTVISSALFESCEKLTEIKIPESITQIYAYAFGYCKKLKSVVIPGRVQYIGSSAFDNCSSLESIMIVNPETEISDSAYTINASTTIYGRKNSTAEAYAEKYSRTFIEAGKAESISVSKEPSRKIFYNIEKFDPAGLEIKISYDDDTEAIVNEYELSEIDYSIIGDQDVTVSYGDLKIPFTITIIEPVSISNGQIINCEVKENDKFYYRYVPSISGKYSVYFTEKVADNVKAVTSLYNSELKSIGTKWFGGNEENIIYNFEANKEYFIYVASQSKNFVGNLSIEIRCNTHVDNDKDEFCDVCNYDSALSREEIIPGKAVNVACSNNIVYFKFIPTVSKKYKIYSSNIEIDENTVTQYDTSVILKDKNKSFLIFDNDSGEDRNFRLEYDFVEGETYYFGISSNGTYEKDSVFPVILECVTHVDNDKNYYCDVCNKDYLDIMASGTCGNNITWTLNYKGDLSISGIGSMYSGDVYSPWYDYRNIIENVSISDGITTIGSNAFYNCQKIKSIVLPESIASIGQSAFENCKSLKSVNIPNTVTKILPYTFYNCAIDELALPQNLSSIGDHAFYGCDFANVDIPATVTEIGEYAFAYCSSIQELILPSGLSTVSDGLAYYCSSLNSIVICEDISSIGYRAFANCSNLENIDIPDGVTSIGAEAFSGCSKITEISIPKDIIIIENNTFANCSALKNVVLNEKLENIGDNAFSGCSVLSQIKLPKSLKSIGKSAFKSCALATIDIPTATNEISTDGLYNAFIYCNQLEEVNVSVDNISYCSVDGVWYNKDKTKLIMYPQKKSATEYTIIDTVNEINSYAFYSQDYLEKVVLHDGITLISGYTFSECKKLQSVRLPEALNSIGNYAFYKCSSLSDIAIPNSIKTIGDAAFYNCSSISDVVLSESVKKIGYSAFANCSGLQTISILNPDTEIYDSSSTIMQSAKIFGYEGSTAHNYAEKYSRDFSSLVSIANVEILSDLNKKEYTPFDKIDTTGLTLKVYYEDGTSNTVNSGFNVSDFDRNTIGTQIVTIDYVGHTVSTEIRVLDCCRLNISVVDTFGNTVPGAVVTVVDQAGGKVKKTADKDGFVQIDTLSGNCYIGAMKGNDYIPITQSAVVGFGNSEDIQVVLTPQQAVEIDSEIKELNLEEIIKLGIDTNAPENRMCYEINVKLKYKDEPIRLRYHINGNDKIVTEPEVSPSSGSSGGSGGSWSGSVINTSAGPAYAIIHIPNTVSYLKEFYNVKLFIQFNAAEDMVLRSNKLKLNIPEGLTLMSKLNGNYIETENFEFDTLYGQETKEYEFILRGDVKGSYYFNVKYSGILDFFDEKIETEYTNPEPIEVCGFDDIKINLNFCDEIHDGYLHYNISLLNERNKNIYCPNIDIGEITEELINIQSSGNEEIVTEVLKMYVTDENGNVTDYDVKYDGFGKPIAPIDTLRPNEKVTYEYVSYYVFEEVDIGYLVSASADVLKGMAENVVVGTFHWNPELGGAKKGSIEISEDIIFLNANETHQFNPTIKNKTPQQKIEWSISKPKVANITQNGLVKGLSDGFAVATVTITNPKTLECDWDSCYIFVGEPNSLVLDSVYDSTYYYAEGGFYSQFSSVSDCVEIYYSLSNALDKNLDDLTIYDRYRDELEAKCKPVKPVTVTAEVDGKHLSFDSESYVNTYSVTFDTINFAHAVDDILMLFPYNLEENLSNNDEAYKVKVTYESDSFDSFTEVYEFKITPIATKRAKEHIEAITNSNYMDFKKNSYGKHAIDLKDDAEYLWNKYTNLDIFTNYYEIVLADMFVNILDVAQVQKLSLPSLVPAYIKEWVDSYKTVKNEIKKIADEDPGKTFNISETSVDKLLKKSKYLRTDDETKTDLGMQVDDKVRDWCLTAFKGKNGSINVEKVNKVFASIDKTKQCRSFLKFGLNTTNNIVDYCNRITLFNSYADMENSFHVVIKSFADEIPDGKMKEAVYDYINYTGDFSEQLSTVFEMTGELFLDIGLDAFKTFMGKSFVNYYAAKIFNWIGSITLKSGVKVATTAGFATASAALTGFFTGYSLGICVSDLICNTSSLNEEMSKMISMAEYTPYIIKTLDFYENNMRNSLTDESVDLFEFAFLLHKTSQSKTIEGHIKSIEIKKESILNRWFKAYEKNNLPALICDYMNDKAIIDNMQCCVDKDDLSTIQRDHKVISIKCPVDIIIYDAEGNKIFEVVNDEIVLNTLKLTAVVVNSEKYISLPANLDYSIEIVATDDGTMDYTVVEYNDSIRVRVVDTEDIELIKEKSFNGSIPMAYEITPEEYALESDGVAYPATKVIDKPIRSLSISESSLELCANLNHILTATIAPLDATITTVNWSSSNEDVATVDKNGKIVAVSEGEAVITVSTEEWGFFETCTVKVVDHELKEHEAKTSNCIENGNNQYYECSICGKLFKDSNAQNETTVKAETLPLGDHSFGDWEVVTAATCIEDGLEKRICTLCPHYEEREIKANGHDYKQTVTAPTCTEDGYTTNTCSVCQDNYISDKTEKLGHKGGTANCKDKAICTTCGKAYGEVDKDNHKNIVTDKAVAATCTATGLTEGSHCDACSKVIVAQTITEKLGHKGGTANCKDKAICTTCGKAYGEVDKDNHKNIVTDKAVAATCTATGLTEGSHCDACSKVIVAQTIVEKLPHTEETIPAVKATCSKTGLTEGKKCSVCGEVLVKQTKISKLAHSYKPVTKAPTCTSAGYTTYTCSVCKDTYKSNETEKLGHNMSGFIVAKYPSCTENGLEISMCSRCDYSETREIAATGHDYKDGSCINCGDSKSDDCSCNCHKSGFMGFIWKILNLFYKLFGTNKVCDCGVAHY